MAKDYKLAYATTRVMCDAKVDLADSGTNTLTFYAVTTSADIPANANAALATGTDTLVAITLPTPAFAAASTGGVAAKTGTWSGTVATGGSPDFFRFAVTGGHVWQGTAGASGGTNDIDFPTGQMTWVAGGTVTVSTFTVTVPRE
jgi:hypothetical protein